MLLFVKIQNKRTKPDTSQDHNGIIATPVRVGTSDVRTSDVR